MTETPPSTGNHLVDVVVLLLSGALGKYVIEAWLEWRRRHAARQRRTPERVEREEIDANILTVVKARDELEEDNSRLRSTLQEEREQHRRDRKDWWIEREQLKSEIAELEAKLHSLAEEFAALRTRHGI